MSEVERKTNITLHSKKKLQVKYESNYAKWRNIREEKHARKRERLRPTKAKTKLRNGSTLQTLIRERNGERLSRVERM